MSGPVDPREVEEMSRLRRILNGEIVEQAPALLKSKEVANTIGQHTDATDDMKAILEMFKNGANESVKRIQEEAKESRPLRDALMTQKTKDGVKLGSWEIRANEEVGVKFYDVTNVRTGEAIAHDLTLYESAVCLCKLLNRSLGVNSPQIREVLRLEDDYARYRQEAVMFKHRFKQRTEAGDQVRAAIAEDRYQEARSNALKLREELVTKSKTL